MSVDADLIIKELQAKIAKLVLQRPVKELRKNYFCIIKILILPLIFHQ